MDEIKKKIIRSLNELQASIIPLGPAVTTYTCRLRAHEIYSEQHDDVIKILHDTLVNEMCNILSDLSDRCAEIDWGCPDRILENTDNLVNTILSDIKSNATIDTLLAYQNAFNNSFIAKLVISTLPRAMKALLKKITLTVGKVIKNSGEVIHATELGLSTDQQLEVAVNTSISISDILEGGKYVLGKATENVFYAMDNNMDEIMSIVESEVKLVTTDVMDGVYDPDKIAFRLNQTTKAWEKAIRTILRGGKRKHD